ncbi:MAG: hypothetical protein KGL35_32420 [Bradyrhizobium sp.]|nr:hypothetical protein [Bradyrhizobium sp.]
MKTLRDPYILHRRENRVQPLPIVPVAERGFWLGWCLGNATALGFVLAYTLAAYWLGG